MTLLYLPLLTLLWMTYEFIACVTDYNFFTKIGFVFYALFVYTFIQSFRDGQFISMCFFSLHGCAAFLSIVNYYKQGWAAVLRILFGPYLLAILMCTCVDMSHRRLQIYNYLLETRISKMYKEEIITKLCLQEEDIKNDIETDKQQCVICMEDLDRGVVLNCEHTFHKKCIETWLVINMRCPVCNRNPLLTDDT